MATTSTSILLHIVFSTKNRENLIVPDIEQPLWNYLAGIVSGKDCRQLAIGGTANHVHLLVSMSKHVTVVDLLEDLKGDSSKWIKTRGPRYANFYWQEGYGAFSVGQLAVDPLEAYFANQKEHHRRVTFESELLKLLKQYGIEYDERYLWK